MSPQPKACLESGCTVASDGRCLKGLSVDTCPSYQDPSVPRALSVDDSTSVTTSEGADFELASGKELDEVTALSITSSCASRVIVVAGAVKSGKTTLIAALYEQFLRGHFAGYCFAGSVTLAAFEERCHLARLESGGASADTPRTEREFERRPLLHLQVRREEPTASFRDLLFTDITGEAFELARDSTEYCQKFGVLRRADHIVLLVDGARLVNPSERYEATATPRNFLRRCLDAGMLGNRALVDVLVTKWDIVAVALGVSEADRHLDEWWKGMARDFEPRLGRLRRALVAAGATAISGLAPSFNLEKLLRSWTEESPFFDEPMEEIALPTPQREFDRYVLRRSRTLLRY